MVDAQKQNAINEVEEHIREAAEDRYKDELDALIDEDKGNPKPLNGRWRLSPKFVKLYILGGKTPKGFAIQQKFYGEPRLVELSLAALLTDRGLLLWGVPGTGKSWLSEHIAAAVCGDSKLVVQCTSGTDEMSLRYGWDYAKLINEKKSPEAIVKSPIMLGMESGLLVRLEELTRLQSAVQDSLISIMSEKVVSVAELGRYELRAKPGFNIIATANNKDVGVNAFSKALERRFAFITIPEPKNLEDETNVVVNRVGEFAQSLNLDASKKKARDEIARIVQIFRELRLGRTVDGNTSLSRPTGNLSPGEIISVVNSGLAYSALFGSGSLAPGDYASYVVTAVVKEDSDKEVWRSYLDGVLSARKDWNDLYKALKDVE